ncbi:hypothetical protein DV738_g5665, partial [Chaetothyriales sp. CBS 135597]
MDPAKFNAASPWATTLEQIKELYDSPFTGAVTTRTSLLEGFTHDDSIHQYIFHSPSSSAPSNSLPGDASSSDRQRNSTPWTSTLNTLGYSPITLSEYLGHINEIVGQRHLGTSITTIKKPFILSVTGTPDEIALAYALIANAAEMDEDLRLAMEVNLSNPNVPGKSPAAYDANQLKEYLSAISDSKSTYRGRMASNEAVPRVGIKLPPYTHTAQFEMVAAALAEARSSEPGEPTSVIDFVTCSDTLGSSLVLRDDGSPALNSEAGTGIGGLGGAAIHPLALGNVATLRRLLDQSLETQDVLIIGVGGVEDKSGAERMVKVGAAAVAVASVMAGYDHTIRFWEALSGICSRTIQHPDSQVNRLCITPDKKYLAAAGRHVVRLYDIKSSNPNAIMTFEGHNGNITGVAFHCEGKWMVTSSEDSTVRVWDTRSGLIQRSYSHEHPVNDVVIHPNQGELVSCDRGGVIMIWDLGDDRCTHQLIPDDDVPLSSVSIASDGSLLAAGNSKGDVYLWRMYQSQDSTTLQPCRVFNAHKTYLTRMLLSPDIKLLATCSADHTVRIWNIDMNEEALEALPEAPPTSTSNSAQVALPPRPTSASSTLTSSSMASSPTPQSRSRSSSVQSQAQPATTGAAPPVAPAQASHQYPNGSASTVTPPATPSLSPFNSFTTSNTLISTRRPLPLETTLESHQRWVWDCAFSADSAYLVTVCSDHYARLWEVASATIIRQYNGHHRGAVCVALNDYSSPP